MNDFMEEIEVILGEFDSIGSLGDYANGENQVLQLNQFFDVVGRPKEFEAEVEALYTNYEKIRTSFATLAAWVRDDSMKQLGSSAAALQERIAAKYAPKAGDASRIDRPEGTTPKPPKEVYDPTASKFPWWAYLAIGGGVLVLLGVTVGPVVMPLITASLMARRSRD